MWHLRKGVKKMPYVPDNSDLFASHDAEQEANLRKMVDASMEQVNAINKLIENGKFDSLPDSLKEIARLRLEFREHSLKELGEMLDPPLGKSGVNHRLRKIQEMAENC